MCHITKKKKRSLPALQIYCTSRLWEKGIVKEIFTQVWRGFSSCMNFNQSYFSPSKCMQPDLHYPIPTELLRIDIKGKYVSSFKDGTKIFHQQHRVLPNHIVFKILNHRPAHCCLNHYKIIKYSNFVSWYFSLEWQHTGWKLLNLFYSRDLRLLLYLNFALFPDHLSSCLSPLIIPNMLKASFHNKTQALKTPKPHNRKKNPPESCS